MKTETHIRKEIVEMLSFTDAFATDLVKMMSKKVTEKEAENAFAEFENALMLVYNLIK